MEEHRTGPFVSYAQNGEDVMLWRALRDEKPGFYIDVGAADPDLFSVTRAFYERGWRGLNVEPLPESAARLREARPGDLVIEAALSDQRGRASFHRVEKWQDTGLSTLDPELAARSGGQVQTIEVEVTTLAAICREHVAGEVHFLKIDVEGQEAAVLAGADLKAFRPWITVIEATMPETGERNSAASDELLSAAGYVHVWFDGLNSFYVAEERHASLARHFEVPPNPFDSYLVADLRGERELTEARAAVQHGREEVVRLQAELEALRAVPSVGAPRRPAARVFYRLLRPVLRPVAWRLRAFLLAPLEEELLAVRQDQATLRQQLEQLVGGGASESTLGRALEAVLVTLAMERESLALDPVGDPRREVDPTREPHGGGLGPKPGSGDVVQQ